MGSTMIDMDRPLRAAISAAALNTIMAFADQNLANTAWSVSKLPLGNPPLLDSIGYPAFAEFPEFSGRSLSITAWSIDRFCDPSRSNSNPSGLLLGASLRFSELMGPSL